MEHKNKLTTKKPNTQNNNITHNKEHTKKHQQQTPHKTI